MKNVRLLSAALLLVAASCALKKKEPVAPPSDAQLEARLAEGLKSYEEGDPNWAIAAADDVLRFKPTHPAARDLRTRCLVGLGRAEEAVVEAREGVRVQSRRIGPWLLYAEALAAAGRRAEAVEAIDAAIALAPNASWPRITLAAIAEDAGEDEHAEALLREAVARAPFDANAARALAEFEARQVPSGTATPAPSPSPTPKRKKRGGGK